MHRRAFLASLAAAALPLPTWAEAGSPAFLSAARQGDAYLLHGLSAGGETVFSLPLPGRGHAAAAHPTRPEAVVFARRPGSFALVLDCRDGTALARLSPPEGRLFNGHGAFSADGSTLYTSEVVAEGSAGRIGLWSVPGYVRIGEWASGGVGPHELRLCAQGIIVANGGIQTDPDDRRPLNLATMRPNLTLLSPDGTLRDQVELDAGLRQNSIRHLAVAGDAIAFAMQWQGDPAEGVPLLGLWQPGSPARLCPPPETEMLAMQGYAGSIAATGAQIALTSPRGGVVMIHAASGAHLATHRRADVCGVAPMEGAFVVTDGSGVVTRADGAGLVALTASGLAWDNHLVPVPRA